MMKRYRRSRHRHNRGVLFLLLFLIATFLVSCVAGADPLWIKEIFGVDVGKYDSEEVEQTLEPDGEVAQSLCDTVEILTRNSVHLESFQTTAQAVKLYRDAILNDMLRDNYALYNGNSRNLAEAETAYPQTVLCTLIPQADFENAVYRNFGGTTVSHGSGQVFLYLSRVNAYTAPLQAWESEVTISVLLLEKTAHTYRMTFTLENGEEVSSPYTAVFILREDGSCYLSSLKGE